MREAGALVDGPLPADALTRIGSQVARALEADLEAFGALSLQAGRPALISSLCTVFAESEVINQLSQGAAPADVDARFVVSADGSVGFALGGLYETRGRLDLADKAYRDALEANPLLDVQKYGQSLWYDYIRKGLAALDKALADPGGIFVSRAVTLPVLRLRASLSDR